MTRKEIVKGWSSYPKILGVVYRPERYNDLQNFIITDSRSRLARGGGTSYGDSSINSNGVNIDLSRFNKMLAFDPDNGILHCQSGVKLNDIIRVFHPRGWFLNVTPGTMNATVGGCTACDAHGKNWKAGSFGNYIIGLKLMIQDGSIIFCDKDNAPDLFFATIGGMGMTGVITEILIKLKKIDSSYMNVEMIRFANLNECFSIQNQSMEDYEYLFCWIDSHKRGKKLGRGVLQRANHSKNNNLFLKRKHYLSIPFNMPGFFINKYSVKLFNSLYYLSSGFYEKKINEVYLMDFFYPLDKLHNWYKLYGNNGFIEYQIVIPKDNAFNAMSEILEIITKSGYGSFIAAIKPLKKSHGLMSFPIEGYTLAVDFKIKNKLWDMLHQLDEIVINNNGRVYLAKDTRLSKLNFKKMYSNSYDSFISLRKKYNLINNFSSAMFDRFKEFN